jgi:uncharacterized protein (TIGR03435 family)
VSTLTEAISIALAQALWQDVVVAYGLSLALRALRRRSASVRYVISCAALSLMVLWPVSSALSRLGSAPAKPMPSVLMPATDVVRAVPELVRATWSVATRQEVLSVAPIERWALPLWAIGVVLFSLRAVGSATYAMKLTRRAAPADPALVASVGLAERMRIAGRVRVAISTLMSAPATVGVWRPVLLMPPAAALGLTPEQFEAVIAHELAHIRRHDYLVNILQVLVETLFFYHPAIWWASRQIRVERELCCDDDAVRECGDALSYAKALSAIARYPLTTPRLTLGAANGPLVRRIERLLGVETREYAPSLWSPALAVTLVGACVVAHSSWAWAQEQKFAVASVKQNRSAELMMNMDMPGTRRFVATNIPLRNLIRFAYDVDETRLTGGPDWIRTERFDVNATADEDLPNWTPAGPPPVVLSMLRTLLADRFKLTTHNETRDLPVYALVKARSDGRLGPRASVSTSDCDAMLAGRSGPQPPPSKPEEPPRCGMRIGPGQMLLGSVPMSQFAFVLGPFARRLVIDRTELTGKYNLQLSWTPQGMPLGGPPPDGPPLPPIDPDGASLFVSIQEQLGLKLEPSRAPIEVVVIDQVERPTPD